jgi:hypothetical protein
VQWVALAITVFVVLALAIVLVCSAEQDDSLSEEEAERLQNLKNLGVNRKPSWIERVMKKGDG